LSLSYRYSVSILTIIETAIIMSGALSEFVAKSLYGSIAYRMNRHTIIRDLAVLGGAKTELFVVKVDQQIKGRMKKGLVGLGLRSDQIMEWIVKCDSTYDTFIVEPMMVSCILEAYLLIQNVGDQTEIAFTLQGGINVNSMATIRIVFEEDPDIPQLFEQMRDERFRNSWIQTVKKIYDFYLCFHLTFLEINPLALLSDGNIIPLDMLAKYDPAGVYLWSSASRRLLELDNVTSNCSPEEKRIKELEEKTGASLKFTLLKPDARVWFILFGGGASVCFFDKQTKVAQNWSDLSPGNYGELSGNPSREDAAEYVRQILSLMKKSKGDAPLQLVIGGGIANFTDVRVTFQGIVDALTEECQFLQLCPVKIFARRGGPGYQAGLDNLRFFCQSHNIHHEIHGPEFPLTRVLDSVNHSKNVIVYATQKIGLVDQVSTDKFLRSYRQTNEIFRMLSKDTKCFIYGSQINVAQNMLDYDYLVGKTHLSVVGLIDPSKRKIVQIPVHWGKECILIPIYPSIDMAVEQHPEAELVVNFASRRSAYQSTMELLRKSTITFVSVLAEGIPENFTKKMCMVARQMGKTLLGPSTVGAIFPGIFRIGNAGGKIEAIIEAGLHMACEKGVGLVTRSGGLMNELCHMISKTGGQVAAAVAVGGDRFLGTSFGQVLRLYQQMENVDRIVCLGEMGGQQEIEIADMVLRGDITKPIYALCLGVSAESQSQKITFGHSGSEILTIYESASYKNSLMASVGIHIPNSWDDFENLLYLGEKKESKPVIPFWINRQFPNIFSSISDERGNELTYNHIPVSTVQSVGQVIGLLWFKKILPTALCQYIDKILIVCADHGPSVSGAQNTIITTRAGKDLVSSLVSGLLTIGPRFGGAINEAGKSFYTAWKNGIPSDAFVRQSGIISGIGHRHYTIHNPDNRIRILEEHFLHHFSSHPVTDYARSVELITLIKRTNLILNVDGFIATSLIDAFLGTIFTTTEVEEMLEQEIFNAFFVLARSIGFMGHHIDQKRLYQDLYRAPETSIGYL
jgi:ATP citrate (pro-S)-lyase